MAAVDSLDNILDMILMTEVAEMKDTQEEEDSAQDSVDKFLDLLNPTALKEMKGTFEEEEMEMDAMLGLFIFVVIGIVVVGLLVTWHNFCKSETSTDLEAQQKPGVQEKSTTNKSTTNKSTTNKSTTNKSTTNEPGVQEKSTTNKR